MPPRGTFHRVPESAGTAVLPATGAPDACGLPGVWQGRAAWRVLDLNFGAGEAFAQTWSCWRADPHAPRLLHYAVVCECAPSIDLVLRTLDTTGGMPDSGSPLRDQWFGLCRGTHRISLQAGRLLLTLCIGPRLEVLRDLRFVADCVYATAGGWDAWSAKALARLVQTGTPLALAGSAQPLADDLLRVGFSPSGDGSTGFHRLRFEPPWTGERSRDRWRHLASPATTCAVLGAGLAGAAIAASMARRGWSVQVLDALSAPAAGASGLPVGLLVAQHSQDGNPRSQFSRAGVRLTLQACRETLHCGVDWMPAGVLQLDPDPVAAGGRPAAADDWSGPYPWPTPPPPWATGAVCAGARWNIHAGWIKPARLVHALLESSGAAFAGNARVQALRPSAQGWELLDGEGSCIARAAHVVICNAQDATRLLRSTRAGGATGLPTLDSLQGVGGQLSWGLHSAADSDAFPPYPVHGAGSFVAGIPVGKESAWFAGATYELQGDGSHDGATQRNLERLGRLLPQAHARITAPGQQQPVQAWRGQRCVTPDRMPVCGALQDGAHPSLWISAAMGSRGLSHSILCAELIAAQANGEPLPVAPRLARLVRPDRPRLSDHF